jgi:hypothetical protein
VYKYSLLAWNRLYYVFFGGERLECVWKSSLYMSFISDVRIDGA